MTSATIDVERPASADRWRSAPSEFAILLVLAFAVHALVLQFIFPGYYHPLWPFHSDFYMNAGENHSPYAPGNIIGAPRPIGWLWFYLSGFFGTRGSMACELAVVAANCAGMAFCVRRLAGASLNAASFAATIVYFYLVFAHPSQYSESLDDSIAQVSFGLILIGMAFGWTKRPIWLQAGIFLLGLLSKECYVPSALLVLGACWLANVGPGRRAWLATGIAFLAAAVLLALYGRWAHSLFLGYGSTSASPYHVSLSPLSVVREWWAYAAEAPAALWIYAALATAAAAVALAREGARRLVPILVLPLAGMAAWLPNSLLPNHHVDGYSWLGATLLFAPLIALPQLWATGRKAVFTVVLLLGLLVPIALQGKYAAHAWVLQQQKRQNLLINTLTSQISKLPSGARQVLVTGLDFPFSPFDAPWSLYEYSRTLPHFSVVAYEPRQSQGGSPAYFVTPEEAAAGRYDAVWMFDRNGALVNWTLSPKDAATLEALGVPAASLRVYPQVAIALGLADGGLNVDGDHLRGCGGAYMEYLRYDLALNCMKLSRTKIPANPYGWFYSGLMEDKLGQTAAAEADLSKAVALDDKSSPNPAFQQELDRVRATARK
jgi:hypothetical protein